MILNIAVATQEVAHLQIAPNGVATIGALNNTDPEDFTSLEGLSFRP